MAEVGNKDRMTPGRRLCVNSFPLWEAFLLTFSDRELQSCGNKFTDNSWMRVTKCFLSCSCDRLNWNSSGCTQTIVGNKNEPSASTRLLKVKANTALLRNVLPAKEFAKYWFWWQ